MHQILMETYDENVNKSKVQEHFDEIATRESDWGSGLLSSIEWLDKTFKNQDEAYEWINKNDSSYRQMAVKFVDNNSLKYSASYTKKEKQIKQYEDKLNTLNSKIHYSAKNVKSKFVTCKTCESKISTKYIRNNYCPVCGKDLRPDSLVKKIVDMEKDLHKKQLELSRLKQDEIKKNKRGKSIKWLVKVEYHV